MGLLDPPAVTAGRFRAATRRLSAVRYKDAFPAVMASPPTKAFTAPGGTSPINSGSPTIVPWKTGRVRVLGASLTAYANAQVGENLTNGAWTPGAFAVEFDYYGGDVALRLRNRQTNLAYAWAFVDGEPVTAAPENLVAAGSNSLCWYRLTFGTTAQRRIRVYLRYFDFGGVDIGPTDTCTPTAAPLVRALWQGDSWVEGTGSNSGIDSIPVYVGRMLGVEMCICGQGGTGYSNTAGGGLKAVYGDSARTVGVTTLNPQLVITSGTSNDDGFSGATVGAAATSYFSAIATAVPAAKVIVIGPPMLVSTAISARLANRDAIRTAAAAAPNVIGFIDQLDMRGVSNTAAAWAPSTAYVVGDLVTSGGFVYECRSAHTSGVSISAGNFMVTTYITGSGKVGATNGTGNSDIMVANDGVHPSPEGHAFLGRVFAEAISQILNPLAL